MVSVRAIYDGKTLKLLDNVKVDTPKKVIVTFLESEDDALEGFAMNRIAQEGGAFDFLEAEEEDIYTDDHLKVKYN